MVVVCATGCTVALTGIRSFTPANTCAGVVGTVASAVEAPVLMVGIKLAFDVLPGVPVFIDPANAAMILESSVSVAASGLVPFDAVVSVVPSFDVARVVLVVPVVADEDN